MIIIIAGDHSAVVVGNAQADLLHWLLETDEGRMGLRTSRVIAASHKEALGVLEGLQALGFGV